MAAKRRYLFHGYAAALSGRIVRVGEGTKARFVKNAFIDLPAAALPATGGRSTARLSRKQLTDSIVRSFVRFESATVSSEGVLDNARGHFEVTQGKRARSSPEPRTRVSADVRGLDVGLKGHVRMLVKRVRGGFTSKKGTAADETAIQLTNETGFDANRVTFVDGKGHSYVLTVGIARDVFETHTTFSAITATSGAALARSDDGVAHGTVVKPLQWMGSEFPGSSIDSEQPHAVSIPGFGRVFFGEIMLAPQLRRVTMVRVTLGSPVGGDFAACECLDGGYWTPSVAGSPRQEKPTLREFGRAPLRHRSADLPSTQRSRTSVDTGFSPRGTPSASVDKHRPLRPGSAYYFWFHVGEDKASGAIDRAPTALDVTGMPEGMRLDIVLFAFDAEIEIERGRDVGVFELYGQEDTRGERAVRVVQPVGSPPSATRARRNTTLFFPVKTPATGGAYHLRCNVYCRNVLLQSRLITVEVDPDQRPRDRQVLDTVLDYKITELLRATLLANIGEHLLSVMLNDNSSTTHGFRFYGGDSKTPFKNEAAILGQELTAKIQNVRRQFRRVAWGTPDEWRDGVDHYRYATARSMAELRSDLIDLARVGFRIYDHVAARLAHQTGQLDREARWALEALMRHTGRVQIAAKASATHVLPAAMFYDHPFADGDADESKFTLCPEFERALAHKTRLLDSVCFRDTCPSRSDKYVVCPSGFWGFRHDIGFPAIERLDGAEPFVIPYEEHPQFLVAVSTDNALTMRQTHERRLKKLVDDSSWQYADTTAGTFALMKEDRAQIVYFFCHGGWHKTDASPYLEVGPRNNPQVITRGELSNERILWKQHPPLVFINGCHTTALDPESASDLVSGFREINAVGVIGTEITVLESLACTFAERFFDYLLMDGAEVGSAMRRARIDLLEEGNPLGLIYIPFVLASVKLLKRSAPSE